jgi:predicted dehydrogenase
MAERLRAAVIGVGAMGANHARVYDELPDVDLVAVADRDEVRLHDATAGRSATAYVDFRELLAGEALDLVSIVVPTRQHLPVALAAIERGVAVLIEKPIAASVDDGRRLQEAAPAAGVPLAVGHVERFNPAVQEAKRRLDAGAIGRVHQVNVRRVGPFYSRERDVGVVHDLATHDIDVLRFLLGCEVERVQAATLRGLRTEFEDALAGLLRFESGALAVLDVNWLSPIKVRELMLLGERGMLAVDYLRQELRAYSPEAPGEPEELTFPDAGQAPLREELAAFVRLVRGEAAPAVTAADGIAALRVADALVEAAGSRRAVDVGGVATGG